MKEYIGLREIRGNLIILENVKSITYDELVEIKLPNAVSKTGRVVELAGDIAVILVCDGVQNISLTRTRTRFMGVPMGIAVSVDMLGRVFDGMGRPVDGVGAVPKGVRRGIDGILINPAERDVPRMPMLTGFSAIDGLATMLRGQKLPIFSGDGLPHDKLAALITAQFLAGAKENAVVVFAAMGTTFGTAEFFRRMLTENGALERSVLFFNLINDPPASRLITPRMALTTAEYFAFDHGYDVLVILTDMTAYAESLREIAAARGEIPGRRGYPGYLYSDLASLYERAGLVRGKKGSLTLLPILTLPGDDITHPVADLTGYITEGQIVLDRMLHAKGIFPPISVLPSLSRLMKDGIGEGKTQAGHAKLAQQLFSAYAQVGDARALCTIVGEGDLSETDKNLLAFGDCFENEFINQNPGEHRTFAQTLDIARAIMLFLCG
jgi:V/A-type H+-transporting ATPase subunit B